MMNKMAYLLLAMIVLVPLALVPVVNAQIWSWGYRVEFDKTEYSANSDGAATVQFNTITKAQVRNIILRLYLTKSNGQIGIQEFKELTESPIFTFTFEKSFNFQISADAVSGAIYYVISFDIRGPYDPAYQSEISSMKEGSKINNPSLPAYDSLRSTKDSLNSTYNSLTASYDDLKSKYEGNTSELGIARTLNYLLAVTTIIFVASTGYYMFRKSKVKPA